MTVSGNVCVLVGTGGSYTIESAVFAQMSLWLEMGSFLGLVGTDFSSEHRRAASVVFEAYA